MIGFGRKQIFDRLTDPYPIIYLYDFDLFIVVEGRRQGRHFEVMLRCIHSQQSDLAIQGGQRSAQVGDSNRFTVFKRKREFFTQLENFHTTSLSGAKLAFFAQLKTTLRMLFIGQLGHNSDVLYLRRIYSPTSPYIIAYFQAQKT